MSRHPSSDDFQRVVDRLRLIHDDHLDYQPVDMEIGYVSQDSSTLGCLGCAYQRACSVDDRERLYDLMDDIPMIADSHTYGDFIDGRGNYYRNYYYEVGAEMMALDLGFNDMLELSQWAERYPEVWGNDGGLDLFYTLDWYYGTDDIDPGDPSLDYYDPTQIDLHKVICHLQGVTNRLRKLEAVSKE